jgi:hypothetical protein
LRGDVTLGGYAADMGALPDLVDDSGQVAVRGGQPRGLWTRDIRNTPETMSDDLPGQRGYSEFAPDSSMADNIIVLGWQGPYLGKPPQGVLEDGWKTPLVFAYDKAGGDFSITSLGADGQAGGRGFDKDIVVTIRSDDYLAPVAGYISPHIVFHETVVYDGLADFEVIALDHPKEPKAPVKFPAGQTASDIKARIYFGTVAGNNTHSSQIVLNAEESLRFHGVEVEADGYFAFRGARRIPVGTERILAIHQPVKVQETGGWVDGVVGQSYKIHVGRGINWLENMGGMD